MQPNYKFSTTARTFHWLTVALLLAQIPLAYSMMDKPLGPDKINDYALHKSIGMAIFTLTIVRLAWRWWRPPPPLPSAMSAIERFAAKATHAALYLVLFAMPLTGWLSSSAANYTVSVFGWFSLPNLLGPDHALHERLEDIHQWLAYSLFALVSLHIGAALYHHYARKDNVLLSMLPTGKLR